MKSRGYVTFSQEWLGGNEAARRLGMTLRVAKNVMEKSHVRKLEIDGMRTRYNAEDVAKLVTTLYGKEGK